RLLLLSGATSAGRSPRRPGRGASTPTGRRGAGLTPRPPEVRDDALRGRTGSGGGRAGAGLLTHPVGPSRRLRARGAGLGALRAPTGVVDSLGAPDVPGQGDYREQHRHRGPEAGLVG